MFAIPIIDGITSVFGKVLDKIPDPRLRDQLKAEAKKLTQEAASQLEQNLTDIAKAQIDVNKSEAQSSNFFIAGWRPFMAWASGSLIILAPLLSWALGGFFKFPPFPPEYYNVISTIFCSLAGIRMFEKVKGVASGTVSTKR